MFEGEEADSPFVISGSYLDRSFTREDVSRDGLAVTFMSAHRSLQEYANAVAEAGLLIERLAEPPAPDGSFEHERGRRWQRVPLFLHLSAVRR